MKYTHLTDDQKEQILSARIQALESDHFQHTLNLQALDLATDLSDEQKQQQRDQANNAMTSIEASCKIARDKLDELREARGAGKKKGQK